MRAVPASLLIRPRAIAAVRAFGRLSLRISGKGNAMADEEPDNIVLRHLRELRAAIDEGFKLVRDEIDAKLGEVREDIAAARSAIGNDMSAMQTGMAEGFAKMLETTADLDEFMKLKNEVAKLTARVAKLEDVRAS